MWLLYQTALLVALAVAAPILLLGRGPHYRSTLRGRLGRQLPEVGGDAPLWIHAVSVGEVTVAATVIRALPADLPVVLTTVTPTGQARARQLLGERCALGYLPFDLSFAVERFLDRVAPRALVLVEGELWPLLLRELGRRGIPVRMINGRVSDRSYARMRRLRPLLGPLLEALHRGVQLFGVQTEVDLARLASLGVGADRLTVTGNLKFEIGLPGELPEVERLVLDAAAGRPVVVAGSTMPGEEEHVLDAWRGVVDRGRTPLLLLAPRHPERSPSVAELAARTGVVVVRRSELPRVAGGRVDVVVLDTLGELASLYGIGVGAFIGGTLVPTGGHNPLEACVHGVPVAVGPSMENFREMAETFDRAGAWRRVADARELADAWSVWLGDPDQARELGDKGRALIEVNRGALARSLELVAPLLRRRGEGDDFGQAERTVV